MVTCCCVFSHMFVMAWTHVLLSHVLLSPVAGTWFGHVVYVFVRSWWLVQLSHILEARLTMCLVTCLVKCSSYGDMLRRVLSYWVRFVTCWWCARTHFLSLDPILGHMFGHCLQSYVLDVFGLTSAPTHIWHVLDVFFTLGHVLGHMFSHLLCLNKCLSMWLVSFGPIFDHVSRSCVSLHVWQCVWLHIWPCSSSSCRSFLKWAFFN